jgi:hypothetical protein
MTTPIRDLGKSAVLPSVGFNQKATLLAGIPSLGGGLQPKDAVKKELQRTSAQTGIATLSMKQAFDRNQIPSGAAAASLPVLAHAAGLNGPKDNSLWDKYITGNDRAHIVGFLHVAALSINQSDNPKLNNPGFHYDPQSKSVMFADSKDGAGAFLQFMNEFTRLATNERGEYSDAAKKFINEGLPLLTAQFGPKLKAGLAEIAKENEATMNSGPMRFLQFMHGVEMLLNVAQPAAMVKRPRHVPVSKVTPLPAVASKKHGKLTAPHKPASATLTKIGQKLDAALQDTQSFTVMGGGEYKTLMGERTGQTITSVAKTIASIEQELSQARQSGQSADMLQAPMAKLEHLRWRQDVKETINELDALINNKTGPQPADWRARVDKSLAQLNTLQQFGAQKNGLRRDAHMLNGYIKGPMKGRVNHAKAVEHHGNVRTNVVAMTGGDGTSLPPTEIGVRASPAYTPEEEISRNDHGNWLPDNTRPVGIDVASLPKASLYVGGTTRDKKIVDRYERGGFKPQPRGFTAEQQALILARNDPKFKQLLKGQVKTRNLNQQQINEFVRGSDGVASDVIRQYQANAITLNEALVLAKGSTWAPFVGNWLSELTRDGKITRDQLLEMRAADASVDNVRNGIDMVHQRSSWASDNTSQATTLQTPQPTTLQTPQPTTAPVTGRTRNAFHPWPDAAPNAEMDNAPTRVVSPKPEPDKASGLGQTANKFISGIRKRLNL